MRFRKIKFSNYRCFLDGELSFQETDERNVNLIIGTNGAGKTELLFAFWWGLYGFNFRALKNKEATPYALNSTLYKALQAGSISTAECSVVIEMEETGVVYVVERKAEYTKAAKNITTVETQSVSYYKDNHELSLPVRDESEVNKILTRIVPKAILNGIIFDGERMKQLSSVDEAAVKAIAGVINDITNVELVTHCKLTFEQIRKNLYARARKIAKQNGNNTLSAVIAEIDALQSSISKEKNKREQVMQALADNKVQLQELSLQLDGIKEAQVLERERKAARMELEREYLKKASIIHNFQVSIADGYLACSEPLFCDVETLLTEYDVPAELTVPAVKNILLRNTCICGTPWTQEMRAILESLQRKLPPDNINSAMGEKVHQLRINSRDKAKAIKSDFDALQECNRTIAQLKEKISSISTQITQSGSDAAEEIEARYLETQQAVIDLTAELKLIDDKLPSMERTLESKKKLKGVMSQSATEAITIEKETAFVDKCILALETIGRDNRMFALRQINVRLQQAYSALCEDYALGRRIYIVQFDDSARYQLVTYYEQKFLEAYNELCSSGRKKQLEKLGLSEDEIRETVIRGCAMSNSTGQSKMNTLAFVKAILDYANDPARNELFEVVKEYPLLIDAPFGDIFDHNLEKSADSLHLFSHQVILMLAKESYLSVARHIAPHIATVHVFSKEANEDHSSVSCTSLEAI